MPAMKDDLHDRLLQREMTRKEFLQYTAGAAVVLFGLGNVLSFLFPFAKSVLPDKVDKTESRHGFGSRKFGV